MKRQTKYLVRPHDCHIWELDESNNCYRSWSTRDVTYPDGTRANAQLTHTFENLTENYDFFSIDENELQKYADRNHEHHKFINWATRPDGHGGSKGGTYKEYKRL